MVLFVCTAKVCRSPMAEAIFNALVSDADMPYEARSAGVAALVGESIAPGASPLAATFDRVSRSELDGAGIGLSARLGVPDEPGWTPATDLAAGSPRDVMTPELLRKVFHVEADIVTDLRSGIPLCIPWGLYAKGLVESGARG